jgi:hypothetical protein
MLDYLHLPDNTGGKIDYFPGFSNSDGGSWVLWEKPRGAHMIRITCIAGGGGGGSGFSSNTTTSRSGGGGGGSSAISIVTIPAYVLPDILYVSSGVGGIGAPANSSTSNIGISGIPSYVCIAQDTGVIYRVCYADSGKRGTSGATSASGGSAGNGGTVAAIADMLLASHGIRNFIGGQAGATGGAGGAGGSNITYPTTGLLLSGGAGGGSSTGGGGGDITVPTQTVYNIFSINQGGAGSGLPGNPGREIYQPLLFTGGSGGAANSSIGSGGNGGAGGFGCGGGGGGAGGANAAGGGGKGGNGLVIIHSW